MHELSIAQNIMTILDETMQKTSYHSVDRVQIKVGELAAVDKNALQFSLDVITEKTPYAQTVFEINEMPIVAICGNCENRFHVNNLCFICEYCGSAEVSIVSGDELMIAAIDVCEESS